jgi:hypothetical protein
MARKINFNEFAQDDFCYHRFQNSRNSQCYQCAGRDFSTHRPLEHPMISASHNYVMNRVDNKPEFDNIQLPSEVGLCVFEPKGYRAFQSKGKSG